jgi:hypothetical protein
MTESTPNIVAPASALAPAYDEYRRDRFVRCPSSRRLHEGGLLAWIGIPVFVTAFLLTLIGGIGAQRQADEQTKAGEYYTEVTGASLAFIIIGPLLLVAGLFLTVASLVSVCSSPRPKGFSSFSFFCCPHHEESPSIQDIADMANV